MAGLMGDVMNRGASGARFSSRRIAVLALAILGATAGAARKGHGQDQGTPAVRRSQRGSVAQTVGRTEITIVYSRPVARGRTLFPDVVSWGRTWNPGADSATTITVSRRVHVNGQPLDAGSYTVWLIPAEKDPWTVVFSRATHIWHTPYPPGQDALRLSVSPKTGDHIETLAFYFPFVEGSEATLHFHWGTVVIPLTVAEAN